MVRGRKRAPRRVYKQWGGRKKGFDIQKMIEKTGIEFHWPGYQYMGPGTKLKKKTSSTWRSRHQSSRPYCQAT